MESRGSGALGKGIAALAAAALVLVPAPGASGAALEPTSQCEADKSKTVRSN